MTARRLVDALCHPYRVNSIPGGRRRFNELAGTNLDRIAGISDGIFAVGMTLLVLGLAVPTLIAHGTEGDLWQTLLARLQYGLRARLFIQTATETPEMAPLMRGRILIAQSLYAIAAATCIVFPTWVSIALIFLVQLNYVLAPRIPILHRF